MGSKFRGRTVPSNWRILLLAQKFALKEGEARQYREKSTGCPQSVKEQEKIRRNKKTQTFLM